MSANSIGAIVHPGAFLLESDDFNLIQGAIKFASQDDVEYSKPNPEIYNLVARELEVP